MKFFKNILPWLFVLLSGASAADTFPSRPIKIVTNLPVGASPDVFVRKAAQELEKKYNVPVIVENKPGAAGIISMEYYLSLPADGYSIYFGDFGAMVTMPILYNREHLIDQMKPLTNAYINWWMIATPANIKNLDDLRRALKTNPNYGSWGVGSGGHICGQELSTILGIETTHIPYKEYSAWFVDIINGVLPFSCASIGSSQNYQKSGRINYIATTNNKQDPLYPEVPSVKSLTTHTFQSGEVWIPLYINKKVDAVITDKLEKDLREIIDSDLLKEQAKILGATVWAPTSEEMHQARVQETEVYKKLIKKYNIKINQ